MLPRLPAPSCHAVSNGRAAHTMNLSWHAQIAQWADVIHCQYRLPSSQQGKYHVTNPSVHHFSQVVQQRISSCSAAEYKQAILLTLTWVGSGMRMGGGQLGVHSCTTPTPPSLVT